VLIASFTPGPSNISSASMGVLHGYRHTLNYLAGLAAGFFVVMFVSGWISTALLSFFPTLEPILRYAGAAYILYLAVGVLHASYAFSEKDTRPLKFGHGLMLQVINPKLIIYAFTLFAAFLAPVTGHAALFVLVVIGLTVVAFCATSVWAVFGTVIRAYLHYPRVKTIVNVIFALSLVYTAIDLTGILSS
jgi:cysteine/O-acetylserine efflux protein